MMNFKHTLSLGVALLFCAMKSNAQLGFEIGPSFQVQNTWMYNQQDADAGPECDYKVTFQTSYGLNVGYGFAPRHGIRAGIFVSQMGQQYTTDDRYLEFPNMKYETLTEYIQVPVLYRYNGSLEIANSAFILTVGPQFGWLQKASRTYLFRDSLQTANPINEIRTDTTAKAFLNAMDISAYLGVGATIRFSKKIHMNAMLNVSYSFADALTNPPAGRSATHNGYVGVAVSLFGLFGGPEMAGPPKMR
jgi:hypothetical protein